MVINRSDGLSDINDDMAKCVGNKFVYVPLLSEKRFLSIFEIAEKISWRILLRVFNIFPLN